MRKLLTIISAFALVAMLIVGCQRVNTPTPPTTPVLLSDSLGFNTATSEFSPKPQVEGTIISPISIKTVDFLLEREEGENILLYSDTANENDDKRYNFTIPMSAFSGVDMSDAKGIKVQASLAEGRSFSGFVEITPYELLIPPKFTNFPTTIVVNVPGNSVVHIIGKIEAKSGLDKIVIEDDVSGSFAVIETLADLGGVKDYSFDYDYAFGGATCNVRITAVDAFGQSVSDTVLVSSEVLYEKLENITMMAQGTSTVSADPCFFMEDNEAIGICDLNGRDTEIEFLFYINSRMEFNFYCPANTKNVGGGYKCNGVGWDNSSTIDDLKNTRFEVLAPGDPKIDAIYEAYRSNSITTLDDSFFEGIPFPSRTYITYDADGSNVGDQKYFNPDSAYLIWIRVPKSGGGFKNELMRVNSVTIKGLSDVFQRGLSTINFDILIQK